MSHTTDQLFAELKKLAPSVIFSTSKSHDGDEVWDGDPDCDPAGEGMEAFNIDTTARTILGGEEIEEAAYLGGCWMDYDEPIGDMHGYLPQKLEEAAEGLRDQLAAKQVVSRHLLDRQSVTIGELDRVLEFLKAEMRVRYDEQMAGKSV
jgi:hypothetical protein